MPIVNKKDKIVKIAEMKELFNIVQRNMSKLIDETEQTLRANERQYFELESIQECLFDELYGMAKTLLFAYFRTDHNSHTNQYLNGVKFLHEIHFFHQRSKIGAFLQEDIFLKLVEGKSSDEFFLDLADWFVQKCLENNRDTVEIRDYIRENELEDVRPFNGFKDVEPDDEDQQDYEEEMEELNRQYEKDAI